MRGAARRSRLPQQPHDNLCWREGRAARRSTRLGGRALTLATPSAAGLSGSAIMLKQAAILLDKGTGRAGGAQGWPNHPAPLRVPCRRAWAA